MNIEKKIEAIQRQTEIITGAFNACVEHREENGRYTLSSHIDLLNKKFLEVINEQPIS